MSRLTADTKKKEAEQREAEQKEAEQKEDQQNQDRKKLTGLADYGGHTDYN